MAACLAYQHKAEDIHNISLSNIECKRSNTHKGNYLPSLPKVKKM